MGQYLVEAFHLVLTIHQGMKKSLGVNSAQYVSSSR